MIAVFKRDFRSLFTNVVGWLFVGINLAVYGLYFFAYNISRGIPSTANTIYGVTFLLLITVPILTMRALSEERKNHVDQLLLTSPLSVGKMVVGKFLALASCFTLVVLAMGISPLFLRLFGKVALKESYTALLGYWLYGLSCIAIGVFMSSLTESQMIAAILAIAVLFLGYMMTAITSLFNNKILSQVLNIYDLNTPFQNFESGIIDVSSTVYYLSVIVVALFLTMQVIQKRRWTISSKRLTTGAFSILSILICLAATFLLNFGLSKLPSRYTTIDMTKQKYYTLTSDSKKFLKKLDQDITIYVLNTKDKENKMASLSTSSYSVPYSGATVLKTLNNYDGNKHIKVKFINPDENPSFASQYTDAQLNEGSLIVVNDQTDKGKAIDATNLFKYSMDSSYSSYAITGYDAEGQITAAIQNVTSNSSDKIYYVTGHSEADLGSAFTEYIDKKNWSSDSITLRTADIPDDCTLLVINGPVTDFGTDEIDKVKTYINNGGKILITLNIDAQVSGDGVPNFLAMLKEYGISTAKGMVTESDSNYAAPNSSLLLYPDVKSMSLTTGISDRPSIIVPQAQGMISGGNDSMMYSDIITSSATSNLIDPVSGSEVSMENGMPSAQSYVLGTEVATDGENNNMVVLASTYMMINDVESVAPGQNTRLFANILDAFSKNEGGTISIASKNYSYSTLQFTSKAALIYGLFWGIALPLILIVVGIVIWVLRRRK